MQSSVFTPWASAHGFLANNPTLSVHSGLQSALHLRGKKKKHIQAGEEISYHPPPQSWKKKMGLEAAEQ